MLIASMSGMNVTTQKMMELFGTQGQKNNSALSFQGSIISDDLSFSSIITNLKAEPSATQKKSFNEYSNDINERSNKLESHRDNNKEKYGADEVKRKQDSADSRTSHDKDKFSTDSSSDRQENSDRFTDNNKTDNYRTDGSAGRDSSSDNNKEINGNEGEIKSTEAGMDQGTRLKVGAMLAEMAKSAAGEITDGESSESAVKTAETAGAGEGTKTGSVLFDMVDGKQGGAAGNTLSQNGEAASSKAASAGRDAGLNINDILKDLVRANASNVSEKGAENGDKNLSMSDAMKSEAGLKSGEQLFTEAGKSTEGKNAINNENLINAMKTQGNKAGSDMEELLRQVERNAASESKEIKISPAKEMKLQNMIADSELQESIKAGNAIIDKAMPEFVAKVINEVGLKNNASTSTATTRMSAEENNINIATNFNVRAEGGRASILNQNGTIAKPAGFEGVMDKIVYFAKGDNRLGVTLEHKDLGKLNINLTLEKGIVNVQVNASDKAVREYVENHVNQIIETLSKNGVHVGGFNVGLRNQQNSEGRWDGNGRGYGKNNPFSLEGIQETETMQAAARAGSGRGLVNIMA